MNYSKDRVAEAYEAFKIAFAHKEGKRIPFIFTVNGYQPARDKNYTELALNHEDSLSSQIESLNYQFKMFPDCDRIPVVGTHDTGQGVIPSMFGAKQAVNRYAQPFTEGRIIENLERDLPKIKKRIDPFRDGWGPFCLERLRFFIEATEGDLYYTYLDHQSPFGLATKLLSADNLILEMFDHPDLVHELLSIITQAVIDTIEAQRLVVKEATGDFSRLVGNVYQPFPHEHMIIWDDFVSVLSPDLWNKFCRPYNEKIYQLYGPGHLHTCGPLTGGPIDSILSCRGAESIDLGIITGFERTKNEVLAIKKKVKGRCVCIGPLAYYRAGEENVPPAETTRRLSEIGLDYVREMNESGGFIWCESGTVEDGKRLVELAAKACV